MTPEIQINQKLIEREECLVEVFELEERIHAILKEPYPLPPPPALPSRRKPKKRRKQSGAKSAPTKRVKLRKLNPDEVAYRVTYKEVNKEQVEDILNLQSTLLLVNHPLPEIKIIRVETLVQARGDIPQTKELEVHEILYNPEFS